MKEEIKTVSNIVCEYIITSDKEFFNSIGEEETKRYFETAYKFVCDYKNLGEQYILSAKVHMDEETPYMHLAFIPVVHTQDKKANDIEKIEELIIKPKDKLIEKLHEGNCSLHHELYKQCGLVDKAEKYEKERQAILVENKEIKENLKTLENDYDIKLKQEIRKVENKYEDEICHLEKDNKFLKYECNK